MNQQPLVNNIRDDLVHPELSFKIMGCAFDVYNTLGYGYAEKEYQKALAISFRKNQIAFKEQFYFPLKFEDELLKKSFCDFIVEEKIIVELKKNDRFSKLHIEESKSVFKIQQTEIRSAD